MKINSGLLAALLAQLPETPPEVGGLLGGQGEEVTTYVLDSGRAGSPPCSYTPNIAYLNDILKDWARNGIVFQGMFHTHFYGVRTLSQGDKNYIFQIMEAMPKQIQRLYFPVVVLPEKELALYKAVRSGGKIEIVEDILQTE